MKTNATRKLWWLSAFDFAQLHQSPIRSIILEWSPLGVNMNDGPMGWASVRPSGPGAFELQSEMSHQMLVKSPWLPLACFESSFWKLLLRAHYLFNTCWCVLHWKPRKCFSSLHWCKWPLLQSLGCVILPEHFLHHQFCFADSKETGNISVNAGWGKTLPLLWQPWRTESKLLEKVRSHKYLWGWNNSRTQPI